MTATRSRPPSISRETACWAEGRLLVGVDEVGRGPLAGPVVAAAVAFPPSSPRIRGLRDSKVLTAKQRAVLARRIRQRACACGLGAASVREIDRLNIRVATARAMTRAIEMALYSMRGVAAGFGESSTDNPSTGLAIVLDGLPMPELGFEHESLIDGDARCYSIAAAGVVAKTVRDRLMISLSRRYPPYHWGSNMGYGTEEHRTAIDRVGATPHHRSSFAPVAQLRFDGIG